MSASRQPVWDPTGDRRAELLARLEYDVLPLLDERTDVAYFRAARREARLANA